MKKIPNVFQYQENFKGVRDEVNPECQWVLDGEGIATEKLDGTNVRLTIRSGIVVRVEKRRNPTKKQKKQGIVDPWYIDASRDAPEDGHIFASVDGTGVQTWIDGEYCCEAVGPNIQGNPLGLEKNVCYPFDYAPCVYWVPAETLTYEGLKGFLKNLSSIFGHGIAEGIVFHHPDGRRAKIRRKDFRYPFDFERRVRDHAGRCVL